MKKTGLFFYPVNTSSMILFILLGLLIAAFLINKIYFGKSAAEILEKESEKTKKIYQKDIDSLISWQDQDIELLSYHLVKKSERKGFGYSVRGIFTSVYQENMLVFQHKKPIGRSKGFTIVITRDHEIWYDGDKGVYVNGEYLGQINKKYQFGNKKLRRVFGSVGGKAFNEYDILSEEGETLGSVRHPENWDMPFPRALSIYKPMDTHDLITFKVLACMKMIEIFMAREEG